MTVSEKLQILRRREGMTQEQFAERIGVTRQALSKWENGETLPDTVNLISISRLFGVSIDRLLNDELDLDEPQKDIIPKNFKYLAMRMIGGATVLLSALITVIMAVWASIADLVWYVGKYSYGTVVTPEGAPYKVYRGLWALLESRNLWWFFWLLVAMALCGVAMIVWPSVKRKGHKL